MLPQVHPAIVPDVVICCGFLHNVLLKESHEDVERLLEVVHRQNVQTPFVSTNALDVAEEVADIEADDDDLQAAEVKKTELGVFLTVHRVVNS